MPVTEVFTIIMALIIVITRITLSTMEDRDAARGLPINHREYTFSGLLGMMLTDMLDKIKAGFKGLAPKRRKKK